MRNRHDPDFFQAVKCDPHLRIAQAERDIYIQDVNKKSTRILLPIIRFLLVSGIHIIRFIKRILPFKVRAHGLLNVLGVWFMKNFISPQALEYIIKHFQYETALINFVVDNCGSDKPQKMDLMPTHVSELGDRNGVNAIMLHDFNIYNHIIDTGMYDDVNVTEQLPLAKINFDALDLPAVDIEQQRKRWLNLDIETSAYIMVFFLVLFLSDEEGERAALSLQFDESLFASLANLTGNDYFRHLCPIKFTHTLRYHFDVVKDLRTHMMSIDFAYNEMLNLKTKQQALKEAIEGSAESLIREEALAV